MQGSLFAPLFLLVFCAGTVLGQPSPQVPSDAPQEQSQAAPAKKLLNFLSLLIPELNAPKAEPIRKELLLLIENDPRLAQRIALLMKKHYDPSTGTLNAQGILLSQQISQHVQSSKPGTAIQLLDQIAKSSPILQDKNLGDEASRTGSGEFFTGEAPLIRNIDIETVNVFDPRLPEENWWLFRLANKIHFTTKDKVVRRELLQKPGDRLDALLILESERNLRAFHFIKKAEIRPVPVEGGKLDLKVRTQDSWTTNINLGLGTEGGEHYYSLGASEGNLFGLGKTLGFDWSRTGDVLQKEFRYLDPALLGSRMRLISLFADTSQGRQRGLDLYKPFYSLRNPNSYSLTHVAETFITNLYAPGGGVSSDFEQNHTFRKANYSLKMDKKDDEAQRLHFNYLLQKDEFRRTDKTAPGTLPQDRKLSGPSVGYSLTQGRYIKEENINKIQRTEDFNLGHELKLEAGYLPTAFGSDKNRAVFNVAEQKGLQMGPGFFGLGQVGVQSRVAEGRLENGLFYGNVNLFRKLSTLLPQTLVLHLEGAYGKDLDGENQMRLGGDTGLRGYKNNALTGNKSLLANAEWRVSHPREYFRLLHIGAAAFADYGAVAPAGRGFKRQDFKADVGAGLRFSPSRSSGGTVARLDVAYALNSSPGQPRFVVTLVAGQAFSLTNNAIKRLLGDSASSLREEDTGIRSSKRKR